MFEIPELSIYLALSNRVVPLVHRLCCGEVARIVNRPTRWVTYASMVLAGLVAALGLVVVVYGAYLATFLELPKSDDHPPLRLYSGPFLLQPDLSLAHSHLLERLQRLGYRRVTATSVSRRLSADR